MADDSPTQQTPNYPLFASPSKNRAPQRSQSPTEPPKTPKSGPNRLCIFDPHLVKSVFCYLHPRAVKNFIERPGPLYPYALYALANADIVEIDFGGSGVRDLVRFVRKNYKKEIVRLLDEFSGTLERVENLKSGIMSQAARDFLRLRVLITNASRGDFLAIVEKCPRLSSLVLTIDGCSSFDYRYIDALTNCISNLRAAEKIVIASYRLFRAPALVESLEKIEGLKILGLIGIDVTDDCLSKISRCEKLTVFSIGMTENVTPQGLCELAKSKASIEVLGFFNNAISPSISGVFVDPENFKDLRRIVLCQNWEARFIEDMAEFRPDIEICTLF